MSAAMSAYASPSSRPTCLTSSAGCQPCRHAAVTERRRKPAISRLTARVQPGDCSAASSLRYSVKPRSSPRQTASTAALTAVTTSSRCDGTLCRPGDQPRSAARSARRRWRSLSFFCRRLRLAFPTMRTSVNSDPGDRIPPDARSAGADTLQTPRSIAARRDADAYRAVPRRPHCHPPARWDQRLGDCNFKGVTPETEETPVTDVTTSHDEDGAELSAADEQLLRELTARARTGGLKLTGEGGLLGRLTKMVVEGALEGELDDHLGYGKHDPAGRDGGNWGVSKNHAMNTAKVSTLLDVLLSYRGPTSEQDPHRRPWQGDRKSVV